MKFGCQKIVAPNNVIQYYTVYTTGWCSTPTLLLICSSFSRENGQPLLVCSSLITAQTIIQHSTKYQKLSKNGPFFGCFSVLFLPASKNMAAENHDMGGPPKVRFFRCKWRNVTWNPERNGRNINGVPGVYIYIYI